jgi:fibronectin type III domain protein
MTEWLILSLLVPAIVVPIVLLTGFAGCDVVYDLERPPLTVPMIDSVEGTSGKAIAVTWTYSHNDVTHFDIERRKLPESTVEDEIHVSVADVKMPGTNIHTLTDDNRNRGLKGETAYEYRVRAIGDGQETEWSTPVSGATFPFQPTFTWTQTEVDNGEDRTGWQGYSLIQRIEPSRLSRSGEQVRITLRASSAMGTKAAIDRVYISKPDPRPGADPYDSDPADLTAVATTSFVLPAVDPLMPVEPLEPVNYVLDAEQPLLIAVDFNPDTASDIRAYVNPTGASTYEKPGSAEATNSNRSGFSPAAARIFLIDKVEVV